VIPSERLTISGTLPQSSVSRVDAPTVILFVTGVSFSRRNVKVTPAGVGLGLITSTNVLKNPCDPSAKNQSGAGRSTADPV
jgi:hypothetical protein